jgi:hypothetical protein
MISFHRLIYDYLKFINLDLTLNSYLGIFLILVGLIVRMDFKFIIQKDLE